MNDLAIDLSRDGRPLNLQLWISLSDTNPEEWRDLVVNRYLHTLFHVSWDPMPFSCNFSDN